MAAQAYMMVWGRRKRYYGEGVEDSTSYLCWSSKGGSKVFLSNLHPKRQVVTSIMRRNQPQSLEEHLKWCTSF